MNYYFGEKSFTFQPKISAGLLQCPVHPPIAVLGATHVDLLLLYRHKLWQIYRKLIEKITAGSLKIY